MSSPTSRRFVLLTATALVGVTSAWWLGRPQASSAPPPTASRTPAPGSSHEDGSGVTAAQLNDLRRELEGLRQQNQQLAQRLDSAGAARAPVAPPPPEPPAASAPLSPEELEARFAGRRAERLERLELVFQREAREAAWAQKTESLVTGIFRQDSTTSSHLEHLDCRTQLCRIELSHQDVESREHVVEQLMATPGLQGQLVVQKLDGETPPRSVLYVAREGTRLPRLGTP